MPRVRARTSPTAIVAAALLCLLAACAPAPGPQPSAPAAAPDPRPSAEPLLTDVLRRIDEQRSVRSSVRGDLGFVGELSGEAQVRYEPGRADVALRGTTRPAAARAPQPVELAVIDDVGYLKSPLLRPEPGRPWLRLATDGTDFAARLLAPALGQVRDAADPRATFTGVESATKIDSVVPDEVDGVPATRYGLRVLTGPAAETSGEPQRSRMRRAADAGQAELGYDLWLDERGLPLRFAATQQVAQAGQVSLTSTYRDWGAPVEIEAPSAEEVGRLPSGRPPR
ncbi:hypothetical protein ACL03H_23100 [Saccharopolyspora sp. MS10]|uniref:hypothetical protein n=1 Tax=Saccharopolyspora sp. MS10 TaxID=3385973 RepID=UPI0039A3B4D1